MRNTFTMVSLILVSCISGCATHGLGFTKYSQGLNTLQNGDSIILTEVVSSSPDFKLGDTVTVKGNYTLSSHPEATLLLSVTATEDGGNPQTTKDQRTTVIQGEGEFVLTAIINYEGLLHLTFYNKMNGSPIGGFYFGTKEQVAKAEKLMGKE